MTLSFMLGILAALWIPSSWPWIWAPGWLMALLFLLRPAWRSAMLLPLLILGGATHATLWNGIPSGHDLRGLLGEEPSEVVIEGRLTRAPELRPAGDGTTPAVRLSARVAVSRLQRKGGAWEPARGRVQVRGFGREPVMARAGALVRVGGVIRPPESASAPGLYDARALLGRQRVHHELETELPREWAVMKPAEPRSLPGRWAAGFVDWGRAALSRGLPVVDEPVELLWAMLLGWREALRGETAEPFIRSGTMHLFAISGLHVGIIAMALEALLRLVGLNRRWSGLLVIPLLWFYAWATGWQPSAVRSTIMMSVVMAGRVLERPDSLPNSLAVAAGLILVWDPNQLFQPGFQLSFMVVLALVLARPLLDWAHAVTLSPDPLKPLDPAAAKPGLWRKGAHYLLSSAIISVAAWLGSLPLVAWHFHMVSLISIPANVVLIPLGTMALISGLGSLLVAGWCPAVSILFNHSAWLWMMWMQRLTEWIARIPYGAWHVEAPPPVVMVAHYALLVTGGMLLQKRTRLHASAVGLSLAALIVSLVEWQGSGPRFRLTVLADAGGHMVHIEERGSILVDCGDESSVQWLVRPYLRARGVDRLEALVLTHGDKRHVGGALPLAERFPPSEVVVPAAGFRSTLYRDLTNTFAVQGRLRGVDAGEALGGWQVLHPARDAPMGRADDSALVLYRNVGGVRFLLLSDLGFAGQNELLNRHPELRADVVVAGLPDASRGLASGFLEVVRPARVIVGDSRRPASERAGQELRARLREQVGRVEFTSELGAVTIWRDAKGWRGL